MIGADDVRAAARVLDGVAHRTPVITSRTLGEHVMLKPENLQRGGAFKFRGAYNKISSLDRGTPVLAYSSGNHTGYFASFSVVSAAGAMGFHPLTGSKSPAQPCSRATGLSFTGWPGGGSSAGRRSAMQRSR